MSRKRPFVCYRGVAIYKAFERKQLSRFHYSLFQREDAGTNPSRCFDIRLLPLRYRVGLAVETDLRLIDPGPDAYLRVADGTFLTLVDVESRSHKEALRRAIDGRYDFLETVRTHVKCGFRLKPAGYSDVSRPPF